jgi:CubicO group peptidase (beta-lactamase class C family)
VSGSFHAQSNTKADTPKVIYKTNLEQKVDGYVQKFLDLDIFSGVVLASKNDSILYHKAFGLANREEGIKNTLDTKFLIGSMNKSFTRVIILQLIAEGKLDWEDLMVEYLDGFGQPDAGKITIRHLVEHESGFGDYESREFVKRPQDEKQLSDIVDLARGMPLFFPPGERQEYSNTGYVLLGAIIEQLSGKGFLQNVDERIIRELDLQHTYITNTLNRTDRAKGYMLTITGMENTDWVLSEPRPDGGFWCTSTDISTFYRHFYNGDKLIPASVRNSDKYFQWISNSPEITGRAVGQAGGTNGHNSSYLLRLRDGLSILVLANMDEPVAENLSKGIFRILNGEEAENPQLPALLNTYKTYQTKGVAYLKENFAAVTNNFHPSDARDLILNNLGYRLMELGKINEALELLELNTQLFPGIANCWDSYGAALAIQGKRKEAISAYEKALKIRPGLLSARKAIQELQKS